MVKLRNDPLWAGAGGLNSKRNTAIDEVLP